MVEVIRDLYVRSEAEGHEEIIETYDEKDAAEWERNARRLDLWLAER